MKRLRILTLCTVLLSAAIFFGKKRSPTTIATGEGLVIKKEWLQQNKHPQTPIAYRRPADQTLLTFPEWYLVFSPDEQAQYYKRQTATTFPFVSHTAQIWQSYHIVNNQIKDNFAVNTGYHFMIWVIGSSASAEYMIKAWYETLIGRITDTHTPLTAEDKFNAVFTQDYVDFIKDKPWYEFDFKKRLDALWSSEMMKGDHWLRKAERRYILTSELLVKTVYGKLIGLGTQTVYEAALPTTEVLIDSLPAHETSLNIVKRYPDHSALVSLTRYNKFNTEIRALAQKGYRFREIAGNNSAILLTILVPTQTTITVPNTQTVFSQPVASDTAVKRIALAVPVGDLHTLLLQLDQDKVNVEHVFDY